MFFRVHHQKGPRKEKKELELELNWTHNLLACADTVNFFCWKHKYYIKNIEILLGASKEVGLEESVEKT
jgi:hypothetical protein